jgi:hypothetical protein
VPQDGGGVTSSRQEALNQWLSSGRSAGASIGTSAATGRTTAALGRTSRQKRLAAKGR